MDQSSLGKGGTDAPGLVHADVARVLAAEDMREYAIFALDAAGNVSSWNSGAARLKGYRSDEVIGRHFSLFYPTDAVESGYPRWELEQAAEHGFLIDRGWRIRKDGTRYWAHLVITAQRSPTGVLDGFVNVVRDESEADARQQRSLRRFTDLFELAPVGIALFDDSGRLLDANRQLSQVLGYQLHDFFAMSEPDFLHPTDLGGGLFPNPWRSDDENLGGPVPHRVLARSDGEPVLCQVHNAASVRQDGSRLWLLAFHDVTAQVRHAEALEYQATHDNTTGLLNRRGFEDRVAATLPATPTGQVAVLFCDLDNFKRVNDSLGHEAGDEVLATVANRLSTGLPPACTPARFYGDEFVIICADVEGCGGLDELRKQVVDLFRIDVTVRQRIVHVSASVGVIAVEDPETTVTELMQSAEATMIRTQVQRKIGGNAQHGQVPPKRAGSDELAMEESLRKAISQDRLGVHYQPIVSDNGSIVLAEALLRWVHPELGPIAPDLALTVARRGGLLAELDRCVLRNALRESVDWRLPDGSRPSVTVNLAGLRPEYTGFTEAIRQEITEAQAEPTDLVLEMVETVVAELDQESLHAMREVADTGVRFAMDDFGSGYSSLTRLRILPTQILKLDGNFVSGIDTEPVDLGIARAVSELARTMGHQCIAEGVENATQYHLLRAIGINAYQGYLFSPPLSGADFRALLARSPLSPPER